MAGRCHLRPQRQQRVDLLREDVDAEEDPIMEADPRPTTQAWLAERRDVEEAHGGHQRRPYHASMYCDDNVVIVVGAARAVRILRKWRALTTDAGLLMAIPEKRSLGVCAASGWPWHCAREAHPTPSSSSSADGIEPGERADVRAAGHHDAHPFAAQGAAGRDRRRARG